MDKRVLPIPLTQLRGQRYLLWIFILVFASLGGSTASAQICCPAGCVQDSNRCVTIGTNQRSCPSWTCSSGANGSNSGSSGGTGSSGVGPPSVPPPPPCVPIPGTQAENDVVTNNCMASLTGSAQFVGCLFEDAAGRAEDQRTNMSCADRQAALAKQCRSRCATFAKSMTGVSCDYKSPDQRWQSAFGDIGGTMVGSAHVQDCGPPLKPHFSLITRLKNTLFDAFK
ncbi:hypothetical protein [Aquirhabdus sp.]|uniref:hypothetical protein n=1 Tax=Aquirhabdus sp. TaxID=2824160 RepID=UPI00396CD72D